MKDDEKREIFFKNNEEKGDTWKAKKTSTGFLSRLYLLWAGSGPKSWFLHKNKRGGERYYEKVKNQGEEGDQAMRCPKRRDHKEEKEPRDN